MSFITSLSGLKAAQTDLSVVSNNIANGNSTGFKKSKIEFQDLLYQSTRAAVGVDGRLHLRGGRHVDCRGPTAASHVAAEAAGGKRLDVERLGVLAVDAVALRHDARRLPRQRRLGGRGLGLLHRRVGAGGG